MYLAPILYTDFSKLTISKDDNSSIRTGGSVSVDFTDSGTIRLNAKPSVTMDKVELLLNEASGITEIAFASSTDGRKVYTARIKFQRFGLTISQLSNIHR